MDLHAIDLNSVALVLVVESVVFLFAVIWAGLRKKNRIEEQIVLNEEQRLAQRIQSQQTEIEILKQQLAQLKYRQTPLAEDELMSRRTRQTFPRCESNGTHELTKVEIAQRDDALADFASEKY